MNRTNVQLLRDTLAKHYLAGDGIEYMDARVGFNMARSFGAERDNLDECDTIACLAGWSNIIRSHKRITDWMAAGPWLGLSEADSDALFRPDKIERRFWGTITVPEALLVLDHLLATGKVDWSIILARREQISTNGYVPASPVYGRVSP